MTFLYELLSNHMLLCAVTAYFAAQILKIIVCLIRDRRLDMTLLVSSGGMPSSHASTVTALSISSARVCGVDSPIFAVTAIFAAVVMYDAAGVRRAAGEQAKILNRIMEHLAAGDPALAGAGLKELIGHTPFQVIMGALLGFVIPFLIPLS